jgi:hypothetical protein
MRANSLRNEMGPVAAKASKRPRFDPNRWTSVAGETPASLATTASVRCGPRRTTARRVAAMISASLVSELSPRTFCTFARVLAVYGQGYL